MVFSTSSIDDVGVVWTDLGRGNNVAGVDLEICEIREGTGLVLVRGQILVRQVQKTERGKKKSGFSPWFSREPILNGGAAASPDLVHCLLFAPLCASHRARCLYVVSGRRGRSHVPGTPPQNGGRRGLQRADVPVLIDGDPGGDGGWVGVGGYGTALITDDFAADAVMQGRVRTDPPPRIGIRGRQVVISRTSTPTAPSSSPAPVPVWRSVDTALVLPDGSR